ncbi:MAG: sugar ABC transporter ATP-binding protein [Gemmobacter sp.]
MTDLALSATGITKRFGALVAVEDCAFDLARGEVHALLGSNGCGKSTLCKVMAGALAADAGTVLLDGKPTVFKGPLDARRGGIATVYQELSLIPTLSVAENIALGTEPGRRGGMVDRAAVTARAEALIASVGALAAGLDPDALVGELPIDRQQIVEILKALAMAPRVILFDESTSSLDRAQVDAFFALVRRLQSEAVSIIFISHRMEEIFAIADRVTVMRGGTRVGTRRTAETTRDDLVELMVGGRHERGIRTRRDNAAAPVLEVDALSGGRLSGITLDLRPGEVLGLGGLHGQGQSEFLLSVFGALPATAGRMTLGGRPHAPRGPHEAIRAGLAYVSGDRGRAGALHGRPILENMALSTLSRRGGLLARRGALAEGLAEVIDRLKLKYGRLSHPIGTLSGGNQQKAILGRALAAGPRVLLLDDPTKGIDVRAKEDLYTLIRELGAQGTAVILYSSEDHELLENADRVLVFNGGQVVEELAGERLTEFHLYSAALRSAA